MQVWQFFSLFWLPLSATVVNLASVRVSNTSNNAIRFSWEHAPTALANNQLAFRVVVSSKKKKKEEEESGDSVVWDSSKVVSDALFVESTAAVVLFAREAEVVTRYDWTVQAWLNDSSIVETATSSFVLGLKCMGQALSAPVALECPRFRMLFEVPESANSSSSQVASAADLHVASIGPHEVFVNGKSVLKAIPVVVGMNVDYEKQVSQLYDISTMLRRGVNEVEIQAAQLPLMCSELLMAGPVRSEGWQVTSAGSPFEPSKWMDAIAVSLDAALWTSHSVSSHVVEKCLSNNQRTAQPEAGFRKLLVHADGNRKRPELTNRDTLVESPAKKSKRSSSRDRNEEEHNHFMTWQDLMDKEQYEKELSKLRSSSPVEDRDKEKDHVMNEGYEKELKKLKSSHDDLFEGHFEKDKEKDIMHVEKEEQNEKELSKLKTSHKFKIMMMNVQDLGGGWRPRQRPQVQIDYLADRILDHDFAIILEVQLGVKKRKIMSEEDLKEQVKREVEEVERLLGEPFYSIDHLRQIVRCFTPLLFNEDTQVGLDDDEFITNFALLSESMYKFKVEKLRGPPDDRDIFSEEHHLIVEFKKRANQLLAIFLKKQDQYIYVAPTVEEEEPVVVVKDGKQLFHGPAEVERILTSVKTRQKASDNKNIQREIFTLKNGEAVAFFYNQNIVAQDGVTYVLHPVKGQGIRGIAEIHVELKDQSHGEDVFLDFMAGHAPFTNIEARLNFLHELAKVMTINQKNHKYQILCADLNIQTDEQASIMSPLCSPPEFGTTIKKDGTQSNSHYDYLCAVPPLVNNYEFAASQNTMIDPMMGNHGDVTVQNSVSDHYGLSTEVKFGSDK